MWFGNHGIVDIIQPFTTFELDYIELSIDDTTPPTTPVFQDSGISAVNPDVLAASWLSTDPEMGITEYQYAIGTSPTDPGNDYLINWTSTDKITEATVTGITLQSGMTYYWYVKARNGAGLWSNVAVSDGIQKEPWVEWPINQGGNGHSYQAIMVPEGIRWHEADAEARRLGGHLVTITSQQENDFVSNLIVNDGGFWKPHQDGASGPWIGGWQPRNSPEPGGGWRWVTDEGFTYTNWEFGQPDNGSNGTDDRLNFFFSHTASDGPKWADEPNASKMNGFIVEYNPRWQQVYFNDFENNAGIEWSHQKREVTPGTDWHSPDGFLGRFMNEPVEFSLENIPDHSRILVEFDLYINGSWDGCLGYAGPDYWDLETGEGEGLLRTTFSNWPDYSYVAKQSYPEERPGCYYLGQTGSAEANTLGYFFWNSVRDAVYRLRYELDHSDPTFVLRMYGSGNNEPVADESWGVDNFSISIYSSDKTPPATPVIIDEGEFTGSASSLSAS